MTPVPESSTSGLSIVIVAYDPEWPQLYNQEIQLISATEEFRSAEFHHVGSTAVPGLSSKSIIDILIAIPDLKPSLVLLQQLTPLGYTFRDVHDEGRLFYEKYDGHRFHLHVTEKDSWHYWRLLLFRERLRQDGRAAAEYVALKQKLAESHGHDRTAYSGAKSQFVSRITLEELHKHPGLEENFQSQVSALRD